MSESHYRAKKRMGQNFLKSDEVIDKIISSLELAPNDKVIEVGPGRGSLTLKLAEAESLAEIVAVEYDKDLIGYLTKLLRKQDNVKIINQDFLDYQPEFEKFKLLGNLPYNISSPVIDWTIRNRESVVIAIFMFQKEVADRISAKAGSKNWSPLSIFTQLYFDVEHLIDVPPESFSPPPKVSSAVVILRPTNETIVKNIKSFDKVVRTSFKQRRKLLRNNLVPDIFKSYEQLERILLELDLSENVRAEEITTEQFLKLTEAIE